MEDNREIVHEHLEIFSNCLETLISISQNYGEKITTNESTYERYFISKSDLLVIIFDRFGDLLSKAIASKNKWIINDLLVFPYKVMQIAVHHEDIIYFNKFSYLYANLYKIALGIVIDDDMKRSIINSISDRLVNFDRFILSHTRENQQDDKKCISRSFDYSIQILLAFLRLQKIAIDLNDWRSFRKFTRDSLIIYKAYQTDFSDREIEQWLSSPGKVYDQRNVTEETKTNDNFEDIDQYEREIHQIKLVILIGLGAWITYLYDTDKISEDAYITESNFLENHFDNIKALFLTVSDIKSNKWKNKIDWSDWEVIFQPDSDDRDNYSQMRMEPYIFRYYTYLMLRLIQNHDAISDLNLPIHQVSIAIMNDIKQEIDFFNNSTKWKLFINKEIPEFENKTKVLLQMHQESADRQKFIIDNEIINLPLEMNNIQKFKEHVYKQWNNDAKIRRIFSLFNKYSEQSDIESPIDAFGFNNLLDKTLFTDNLYTGESAITVGDAYGAGLAKSEEEFFYSKLKADRNIKLSVRSFGEDFRTNIEEYFNPDSQLIILCSRVRAVHLFMPCAHFVSKWKKQDPNLESLGALGSFDDIPVIDLDVTDQKIIIIDVDLYGSYMQYKPTKSPEFPLSITITDVSETIAKEILENDKIIGKVPRTQTEEEDKTYIRNIRTHVSVCIREKFDFVIENPSAALIIEVDEESND